MGGVDGAVGVVCDEMRSCVWWYGGVWKVISVNVKNGGVLWWWVVVWWWCGIVVSGGVVQR